MAFVQINPAALRAIRERSGLTIASLASAAGIDRTHLTNIESGRRGCSDETILALRKALKVELSAIITDPAAEVVS